MYHIATIIKRGATSVALIALSGCAVRSADMKPVAEPLELPPAVHVTHFVASPAFNLEADSAGDLTVAYTELRAVARAFVEIFGEAPPPIDVALVATSASDPHGMILRGDIRLLAAGAWMQIFSSDWCSNLRAELAGYEDPPEREITCDGSIPDWIERGAAQLLVDTTAERQAAQMLRSGRVRPMPMSTFLEYRLTNDSARVDADAAFIAQAISVMRFLRTFEGEGVLADFARASVAGLTPRQILSRLPSPMTPEMLDIEWQRWLSSTPPR